MCSEHLQVSFLRGLAVLIVVGLSGLFQFNSEKFGGVTTRLRPIVFDDGGYSPKQLRLEAA